MNTMTQCSFIQIFIQVGGGRRKLDIIEISLPQLGHSAAVVIRYQDNSIPVIRVSGYL